MAVFTKGDAPLSAFDYDLPADLPETIDSVRLTVAAQTVTAETDGGIITGTWAGLDLPGPGMYPIRAEVTVGARSQSALVDYLVVDDPDSGWHTLESARDAWAGAPRSDGDLYRLLDTARYQCEAYAPLLHWTETVPTRYLTAQLMQARAVWNSIKTDASGVYDDGTGFTLRTFPLDWAVKAILRPVTTRWAVA
ncbi:hypothetical protein [Curtobacterium poinsettiae]|uniref:hypothetical protein n=1 Tax=Curtobacterium TaxID=2034 RepID=UPI00217D165F|nr:hypothetical protein [Curtobacterium flaccumfaciens]MCS6563434.1 hypothetical protein [Curtobacterium flaccumfaciens pv. poinsettiae]UXN30318.1 hypothetical protein N8D75_08815 [Curtobacterium flaccumfaciens]